MVIATGDSSSLFGDLLPYMGILLGIVIIGGIILYKIRRSIRDEKVGSVDGFTLEDLRNLHASGKLTDQEFQQAREAMIGRMHSSKEYNVADKALKKAGNDD